jgi:hypothetical protein
MADPGTYLPIAPVAPGLVRGRSVYDGYQRGWGLAHTDLRAKIQADLDYLRGTELAIYRTAIEPDRLMNLFMLIKFFLPRLPFGHIFEFGTYKAGTALFMASIAAKFAPGAVVYALDTFEGMPATDKTVDAHGPGNFGDTSLEAVEAARAEAGLTNLRFVKGVFSHTAETTLAKAGAVALAHIDCDLYEPVAFCYRALKPYMVRGGYYVFDDANAPSCVGATQAVEESVIQQDRLLSEQVFPHYVFRAGIDR